MTMSLRSALSIMLLVAIATVVGGPARAAESPATDCLVGVQNEAGDQLSGLVDCTDGAACDADGTTDRKCVFRIRGALNIPAAGCTPRVIKKVKFKTQKAKNLIVLTPVSGQASSVVGAFVDFTVNVKQKGNKPPKPGKRKVQANAKADGQPKASDKDKATLQCTPCPTESCVPPTTTTTTVVVPTTTTTILPNTILDFTSGSALGSCGETRDGSNALIKNLTCGGLNIGGGASTNPEGPTPDGAVNRYGISCTGSSCTVGATSTAPAPNSAAPDCTDTGCNFGTPLPIANAGTSTCVLNTFSEAASGTLDLSTGEASLNVKLNSHVFITGNAVQPCPKCSAGGTPASPGTGTCDRGANMGGPCTSTNSLGTTRDCLPGDEAGDLGSLPVDLSPFGTSSVNKSDPAGLMCASVGQGAVQVGCFGSPACRSITENGVPAGPLTPGTPAPVTLATVFCIPVTSNVVINAAANLPGPGATSLPGTFTVH